MKMFQALTAALSHLSKEKKRAAKAREPKTFSDPKKQNWSLWIRQFDNHVRRDNNDEKLSKLGSFLDNRALQTFLNIETRATAAGEPWDYNAAKEQLAKEFVRDTEILRNEFEHIRRRSDQSVQDFISDFNSRLTQLGAQNFTQRDLLRKFKKGLGDCPEQAEVIRLGPNVTLKEAQDTARNFHIQRESLRWPTPQIHSGVT